VETAPLPVRCTAVALGYNISLGVIGGLTPLVATWLVNRTENDRAGLHGGDRRCSVLPGSPAVYGEQPGRAPT
jgi:hypothetical protein